MHSTSRGQVIVLNGVPCSGKTTLARAFQADLNEPWLGIDLDTFTPRLPPRRTWSKQAILRQVVAGGNAAVAAVAEAGNNIVIELVARNDPGASFVLADLFERLAGFDVVVVCLRCSFQTAIKREASRVGEAKGLVQRDYGNVDEDSFDALVETDTLTIPEQVMRLRQALAAGPTGGVDRLKARVGHEAQQMDWREFETGADRHSAATCRRRLKSNPRVMIRDARESDLDEILQIRNHAIVHSTATWTDDVESPQDCLRWLAERRSAGDAVLVAEAEGTVVGYAAYTRWRPKPGYRFTVADSVYVVDGHQGKGIGKMLLAELIARATTAGKHVMIADIESTNAVSINLHRSLGFVPAGDLPQIGRKFDRWLDLSILTLSLG